MEPSSNCSVNEPPVVRDGRVTVCSSFVGPAACTSTTPIGSFRDNFAALIAINKTLVDASAWREFNGPWTTLSVGAGHVDIPDANVVPTP